MSLLAQQGAIIRTRDQRDPLWDETVLCINGVGPNGSTAFYDAKGHSITINGTVQIDTSDSDFPGGAIRLGSSAGNYLYISDSSDFDFAGEFTIEFDHKPLARGGIANTMLGMYNSFAANGGIAFFDAHSGSSGNTVAAINGTFPNLATAQQSVGVKRRYRYVRHYDGGSGNWILSLYINDAFVTSQVRSGTLNAVGGIWIGTNGDGVTSYGSNCRMGRIRITRAARTGPQGTDPFPER